VNRRLKSLASLVIDQADRGELPYIALEYLESGTGALMPGVELPIRRGGEPGVGAVRQGDVLFGKLRPYLAKTFLVREPAYASTELMALRPNSGVDSRWLAYLVGSGPLIEWATASSDGVKMPRTSWEQLGEFRVIDIPELAAQRSIADYLDTETARIDALIKKKLGFEALLNEKITSLIQEHVGTIPSRRRLRHLAGLGTGHTPDRRNRQYWENCVIPWVTAGDLSGRENPFAVLMETRQKISALGVANSAAVVHPSGTVMLCRTASVGLICHVGVPMATTQAFVTWSPGPELDSGFLMYALHSLRQEWKRLAFGSTHDTIYMPDLESVKIPYVPLTEQRRIARLLDASTSRLLESMRHLNHQCVMFEERRRALITSVVTGELEVPGVAA